MYWVGLFIIVISLIAIIFCQEIDSNIFLIIFVAFLLATYLLAIPVFIQKNASFFVSYYPAGEVKNVLTEHYFNFTKIGQLASYVYWPGFHTISATLILVTGIDLHSILKYGPFVWIFLLILLVYLFSKGIGLNNKQYLAAIWMIVSSWWVGQYYYSAQAIAIVHYLLILSIIIKEEIKIEYSIILITVFASLVITHPLTPLAIIFCFTPLILRRANTIKLLLLIGTIFFGFYLYISPLLFEFGIREFVGRIIELDLFSFVNSAEFHGKQNSFDATIIHYARMFYPIAYIILSIATLLGYLQGKLNNKTRDRFWVLILWLVGLFPLLAFQYGAEIQYRFYIYAIIVLSVLFLMIQSNIRLILFIAVLFTLLHIPSHYGSYSFEQTVDTELAGSKFLALQVKPQTAYSYRFYPYVRYYDPSNLKVQCKTFIKQSSSPMNISSVEYISDSFQSRNYMKYVFEEDPVRNLITQRKESLTWIYENGMYSIFKSF